jgi:hypothetical protein
MVLPLRNDRAHCDATSEMTVYRQKEVAKHTTADKGIWVTYKDGE